MPVIARDAVASDHLVYAWPFPIGPEEHEVVCVDDEQVVMCPAWRVGNLLGPGRHRWRSPDPMRPVSAYFVLTAPVEVSYDMVTTFVLPSTGQTVRLRGSGSLQVRCSDPALLIAQFVGLPFDAVNEGILRSVSRSIERMLARLLTRRVVMAGTPAAVTDPSMLPNIVEELVAYNPAAGAVFGVELVRMGHLTILADDGSRPLAAMTHDLDWSGGHPRLGSNGADGRTASQHDIPLLETVRAPRHQSTPPVTPPAIPGSNPPSVPDRKRSQPPLEATSGEIVVKPKVPKQPAQDLAAGTPPPPPDSMKPASSTAPTPRIMPTPTPSPSARVHIPVEVPQQDEITQPGVQVVRTPVPGTMRIGAGSEPDVAAETRGSILGIGVGHIGSGQAVSGEIAKKVTPGARVLVPGPNGLMQSATVRQLLQGYYELEVGASGETIWVPVNGVVPE